MIVKSSLLKPIKISSKKDVFRENPNREIDILHTELNVTFNWKEHLCLGKEVIHFKPYFYSIDSFSLDAKNFIIHSTSLSNKNGKEIAHSIKYNDKKLTIFPEHALNKDDSLSLRISYTAQPDKNTTSGSKAIKDDKGLYFINTNGKEPYKPMQLWTQGETESNSNWFITVDKPFEKMTFGINITVPDSMTTLSNGLLTNSSYSENKNNRTDQWIVRKPMSAYLVMMAIGNFEKTIDRDYNGKEVSYYLEPKYHPYAKNIFAHTPEMIRFFSDKLGYPYPWQKYAQVVVHDFVSGAMENTSATLHGEFVQKNNRELIDNQNDGIVAHELFHHWFGDLITCASWSHLTLNEGFATFGEQLWFGHKYGKTAELKRIHKHMNSYLRYSKYNDESPIRFHYRDKEEMFNAIIYQKGSRILNLLKFTLGEEAFFEGLKNYLHKYAFKTAQIEQLRHEFEQVSGKDLRFFFKQWFHTGGHPIIDFSIDSTNEMRIVQTQKGKIFKFPFQYREGSNVHTIHCTKRVTKISLGEQVTTTIFPDPNSLFIGKINNLTCTNSTIIQQFKKASNYIEKIRILENIQRHRNDKTISDQEKETLFLAMNDSDPDISYFAMKNIDWNQDHITKVKENLKRIASFSSHSNQKSQAIYILSAVNDDLLFSDYVNWSNDSSYQVAAAGLYALKEIKQQAAIQQAKLLEKNAAGPLLKEIATIYGKYGDSTLTFFQDNLMNHFGSERRHLIQYFGTWAKRFGEPYQDIFWILITKRANEDEDLSTRLSSFMALHKFSKDNDILSDERKETLKSMISNVKNKELRRRLINNKLLPKPKIEE